MTGGGLLPTVQHQPTRGVGLPFANLVPIQADARLPTPSLLSQSFSTLDPALVDSSTHPIPMPTQYVQWFPILHQPL